MAPVAALLAFAVLYFGVMNDAGLFDPMIRTLIRVVHRDPLRIALGTAAIASVAHLDGAGASTFMVTVPAMLPLYQRLGMSPLTLTCITALAAGTMNMLPWGGPTNRAAAALQVSAGDLFVPVIVPFIAGMIAVFVHRGASRPARAGAARRPSPPVEPESASDTAREPGCRTPRRRRVVVQCGADGCDARGAVRSSRCRCP